MRTMFSLIVTAVGRLFCRWPGDDSGDGDSGEVEPLMDRPRRVPSGSGWITVPPPFGFSTFLIRIGILCLMTY